MLLAPQPLPTFERDLKDCPSSCKRQLHLVEPNSAYSNRLNSRQEMSGTDIWLMDPHPHTPILFPYYFHTNSILSPY